jgi:homoserine O-acetyltransferase/O-succinyltransferase
VQQPPVIPESCNHRFVKSTCIDHFQLEGGEVLLDVEVAYATWGRLNEAADNAVIVCHALTGDVHADVWWGPLIGSGRVLDTDRFFVICANVIGSPYGSVSPLSINPRTGQPYGPDFPAATVRDTVNLHRRLLDELGVRKVQLVLGGSMGGMQVLEWAFHADIVEAIVPIAVGSSHSAWCIGWSEAQRQAIFADAAWMEGRYDAENPPRGGLAAARMAAMISYRTRRSFQDRFGRSPMQDADLFAVESYLRYQGQKLVDRFDANCYVHLTRQMDSHDVARGRGTLLDVLARIEQPALVVGIDSDGLYPLEEQMELANGLPQGELAVIESMHGHDAFLMEFDFLDHILRSWIHLHIEDRTARRLQNGRPEAASPF